MKRDFFSMYSASGSYRDGVYTGTATGNGGTVTVTVTVENGKIS